MKFALTKKCCLNIYRTLAQGLECSPMARETWVQSQVRVIPKTQKMVLDASLLNTQHYKERIKGKVEQSREGVAPSPTPSCSSYRKGSLRVSLDYGRQLYFTYIYIYYFKSFFTFRTKQEFKSSLTIYFSEIHTNI